MYMTRHGPHFWKEEGGEDERLQLQRMPFDPIEREHILGREKIFRVFEK